MVNQSIGLLFDAQDVVLKQTLPIDMIRQWSVSQPDVTLLEINICNTQESQKEIMHLCELNDITKLVICNTSYATSNLTGCLLPSHQALSPIPIIHASVVDHCAQVEKNLETCRFKAFRMIEVAVARARGIHIPDIHIAKKTNRRVAVLGSGYAAYQTCIYLLGSGFSVVLLEPPPDTYCIQAVSTEISQRIRNNQSVRRIENASIHQLNGTIGAFTLKVTTPQGIESVSVGAIVFAFGLHADPPNLPASIKEHPRVVDLDEFNNLLDSDRLTGKKVCIWLDNQEPDGSCDDQNALRLALDHVQRGGSPSVLLTNVSVYGYAGQELYDQARAAQVRIVRTGGATPCIRTCGQSLSVSVTDIVLGNRSIELLIDWLVINKRRRPHANNHIISKLTRQPLDLQGYLQSANVRHQPVASARKGIYFAGGCHDECILENIQLEAQSIATDLLVELPEGKQHVAMNRVIIDEEKCARCLTCMRICPHGAIDYNLTKHRMEIQPIACLQCGICMAACPGGAIEHGEFNLDHNRLLLQSACLELNQRAPVIAFACRQSAIPAASLAGREGLDLPADVLLVDVPCAGLVSNRLLLDTLQQGAKGVVVLGCHHDNCRSLWGSDLANQRIEQLNQRLAQIGSAPGSIRFHTLAANEPYRLRKLLYRAVDEIGNNLVAKLHPVQGEAL